MHQSLFFRHALENDRGSYPHISFNDFFKKIFYIGKAKSGRGLQHLVNAFGYDVYVTGIIGNRTKLEMFSQNQ